MSFKPDDRVRVQIADRAEWAHGAAESLDGALGTVASVKSTHEGKQYLVYFDEEQTPWHANQQMVTAFHFAEKDLRGVVVSRG